MRKNLPLNQSGHAGKTELMLLILLVSVGLAFFIPKIHSGIWNAIGATAFGLFLFFLGLIVLILVISFLGYLKDRFLDWIGDPTPIKKLPEVPGPLAPKKEEPPKD